MLSSAAVGFVFNDISLVNYVDAIFSLFRITSIASDFEAILYVIKGSNYYSVNPPHVR